MTDQFLIKAEALENKDGSFTPAGMKLMEAYARAWVSGKRDLELERAHPELAGPFYDLRVDAELASDHAADGELEKSLDDAFAASPAFTIPQ